MGTVVVGAIVVVIAGLAIRSIRKDKKSGKGCNGNCGSCGGCHSGRKLRLEFESFTYATETKELLCRRNQAQQFFRIKGNTAVMPRTLYAMFFPDSQENNEKPQKQKENSNQNNKSNVELC